jgi:mevalonate pyrophosphate decarboxylase
VLECLPEAQFPSANRRQTQISTGLSGEYLKSRDQYGAATVNARSICRENSAKILLKFSPLRCKLGSPDCAASIKSKNRSGTAILLSSAPAALFSALVRAVLAYRALPPLAANPPRAAIIGPRAA